MKAIKFKECNYTYAETQVQYHSLPGHLRKGLGSEYEFIFCMKLNFRERIVLLFTGKMWCSLLTFGKPLQPSRFSVKKSNFFGKEKK